MKKEQITVQGVPITIVEDDFISLSDIARRFDEEEPKELINNWVRIKESIEFLGIWEAMYNPAFNSVEFDTIYARAGVARFRMSPTQWIEKTGAIGMRTKLGRNGYVLAHRDIAMAFCYWLSPGFQLYLVKEFQRLKQRENPEWDMRRALTKVNYVLHTGAIRQHIIPMLRGNAAPAALTAFSEEADLLNLAVFGITAAQWRTDHPNEVAQGLNIRDTADIYQLLVLANLEAYNETLLHHGVVQFERFTELRRTAERQLGTLYAMNRLPMEQLSSPHLLAESDEQPDK